MLSEPPKLKDFQKIPFVKLDVPRLYMQPLVAELKKEIIFSIYTMLFMMDHFSFLGRSVLVGHSL